jgi:hypothetical protein
VGDLQIATALSACNDLVKCQLEKFAAGLAEKSFALTTAAPLLFYLDSFWLKSQNSSGRDASPKRSVFHPTY